VLLSVNGGSASKVFGKEPVVRSAAGDP
jgi:hypothetical protein